MDEFKKIRAYVTLRPNGLYLVTKFKPIITEVIGVDKTDAYIKPGDPIGFLNVSPEFILSLGAKLLNCVLVTHRIVMTGNNKPWTHYLKLLPNNLYEIRGDGCLITNVCPWFVKTMFNITDLDQRSVTPIHFSVEVYGSIRKG